MTMFTFHVAEHQARNVHRVVDSHIKALKNWIVSRIEDDDLDGAKEMIKELREYEALFSSFNVDAKIETAKITGKPVSTCVTVSNTK